MPSSFMAIRDAQAELGMEGSEDDIIDLEKPPMDSHEVHGQSGPSDKPASKYRRVMLKVSGESLGNVYELANGKKVTFGINDDRVEEVASEIFHAHKTLGVQFAIVVGGGNIWRGRNNKRMDKNQADYIGMLATVQNGLALEDMLRQLGAEVRLNSSLEIKAVGEPFYPKTVASDLRKGHIVICSGGMGETNFTTDTAAAQRAVNLNCEAILMGKVGVNGIYDDDPNTNPEAQREAVLTHLEIVTRRLRVMDATAATHAGEHGIDIVVYDGEEPGILTKVLCTPEKYGTIVRTVLAP